MTDEEIRIKVAESLGWTVNPEVRDLGTHPQMERGHHFLPNYPLDLNACAEFEKLLTYEEADEYDDHLGDICKRDNDLTDNPTPWRFAVTTATARQRCLAYLKTKGVLP